ncbi:MAG: chromosome partitioning protein [Chloroflexota bacterium]|nr:chromosome partitioning protein [Chloroflexota bacterium]
MRTIAVVNRKGGSGKTTTAVSLAAVLAERGLPTLLIDLDPQGSASAWLGDARDERGGIYAFEETRDLGAIAVKTKIAGLEIVRSSAWLLTAERTLKGDMSLGVLRAIQRLKPYWAFVIIDCPPSLSYLSVGALMAVREVIIPVEAHAIAVPGVAAVVREMGRIQSTLNPSLRSPLIVACRVNRTLHARQVVDELDRTYGWLRSRATIRESIKLPEAEAARMPITTYAPESGACFDYRLLADEVVAREEAAEPMPRRVSRWRRLFTRSAHAAAVKHRAI